jgi:hypothetical protein
MTYRARNITAFAVLATVALPSPVWAGNVSVLGTARAGGYQFLNFNGPNAGNTAGAGTNMNGISNSGAAVGVDIENR